MSNMSYCRFENTFNDLDECEEYMDDDNLSESEEKYKNKLIQLCIRIAGDFGDD